VIHYDLVYATLWKHVFLSWLILTPAIENTDS
jgi:hypothetical protein